MEMMHLNRYPRMVHDYYESRVRRALEDRAEKIASLKTRRDAEKYVSSVRAAVKKAFGPMPPRTPLNAKVTGRDECGEYSLEKVVYESRPGLYVTANLYLPKPLKGKVPCVLGVCGHAGEGKACDNYQMFSQGLAMKGFAVLIVDPISQGERKQFFERDGGDPGLCRGHNMMGNQQALLGDFFGAWRVWDAIRGLDYLLSRPEADTSRVGVTGNSGGGTLTSYVTALDSRITMAAPSCYICSYMANIENELPSDAEQNPPGILASGLDQIDLLLCHAPRPTMILSQHDDFFDHRYALERFKDMKKVHSLLGSKGTAEIFVGPRGHGFFVENREAMYGWFLKHARVKGSAKEPEVEIVKEERLFATKSGNVSELGGLRVFEFNAKTAARLKRERRPLSGDALRKAAMRLLSMPKIKAPPRMRPLRDSGGYDEATGKGIEFAIETEPGVHAILEVYGKSHKLTVHPPQGRLRLFVGDTSSFEDVRDVPEVNAMLKDGIQLLSLDPRGLGQSQPKTCGAKEFFEPYGADYLYASTAEMLGDSYLGGRVFDLLRTMDLLYAEGAAEMELAGRGMGSVIVAFAALLHKSKPKVRLLGYLPSYQTILDSPRAKWPLSSMLRGVLRHFDLPDVYRELGPRLKKSSPWNADMIPS